MNMMATPITAFNTQELRMKAKLNRLQIMHLIPEFIDLFQCEGTRVNYVDYNKYSKSMDLELLLLHAFLIFCRYGYYF